MKKIITVLLFLFVSLTSMAQQKVYQFIGHSDNRTLYSKPSTDYPTEGYCSHCDIAYWSEYNDEWVYYTFDDGAKGFMQRKYLRDINPNLSPQEAYDAVKDKPAYLVQSELADVMWHPNGEGSDGERIWSLPRNEIIVDFREAGNDRIAIKLNGNNEGFVNKKDLLEMDELAKLKYLWPIEYQREVERRKVINNEKRKVAYEKTLETSYFKGGLLAGEKIIYIIAVLQALLILMTIIRYFDDFGYEYIVLKIYGGLLLTVCALEYWYVFSLGFERSFWFLSITSQMESFFSGIYMVVCMVFQLLSLYYIVSDACNDENTDIKAERSLWWFFGATILCYLSAPIIFSVRNYFISGLILCLILLCSQIPLMRKMWKASNNVNYPKRKTAWFLVAFMFCAIPTMVFSIAIVLLVLIILVGVMLYNMGMLNGLGGGGGKSESSSTPYKCCSSCIKYSYGKCNEDPGATIHDPSSHCCGRYSG